MRRRSACLRNWSWRCRSSIMQRICVSRHEDAKRPGDSYGPSATGGLCTFQGCVGTCVRIRIHLNASRDITRTAASTPAPRRSLARPLNGYRLAFLCPGTRGWYMRTYPASFRLELMSTFTPYAATPSVSILGLLSLPQRSMHLENIFTSSSATTLREESVQG